MVGGAVIGNEMRFFLAATFSGCQFLAHGSPPLPDSHTGPLLTTWQSSSFITLHLRLRSSTSLYSAYCTLRSFTTPGPLFLTPYCKKLLLPLLLDQCIEY